MFWSRWAPAPAPTYYHDIAPILEAHCVSCHRPGEIGPMALTNYAQARRWAAAIGKKTASRAMPPWFADPAVGHFSNDPSLTATEVDRIARWVAAGAPAGDARQAPSAPAFTRGWNIPAPDAVIAMPRPVAIPASGDVEYTYEIVPTGWTADRWVRYAEIRPSARDHVHHAVIYVRPPGSAWLAGAPRGTPFTASSLGRTRAQLWTDTDILLVYAPGSAPDAWSGDMAKFVPAGSDLVFQMHYTTNGRAARDQTSLGVKFSPAAPAQRVLTLQLTNDHFIIPPGARDVRVEVHGTLPNAATLLSFFPHMHLRGVRFDYNLIHKDGQVEPLLRVNYNFFWQLSYRLATPRPLPAGAELQAVGWYDNSSDNPHNPDPGAAVRWGDQTSDEMMVGFFDLAVPATMNKQQYFLRSGPKPQ